MKSRADVVVPTVPEVSDPEVTRWLDAEGTICALGHTVAGQHWIHVIGVASFCFTSQTAKVSAIPYTDATPEVIADRFSRTVWPTVLQARGQEVLHASAIQTGQGVVALCAPSETGKSTVAYGLSQRGYPLWADDAVVLELEGGVKAVPLPFKARLRPASAVHFGHAADETYINYRWEGAQQQVEEPLDLRAICLLTRRPPLADQPLVTVEKLSPVKAFPRVISHANFFSLRQREQKQRTIEHYLAIVRSTPVFDIIFQSGLENLPQILEELESEVLKPLALRSSPTTDPTTEQP